MKKLISNIKNKTAYLFGLSIASLVGGLTAGIVMASIPDSNGVIHSCRANTGGSVRIIDTASESCTSGIETEVTWRQKGVLAYGLVDMNNSSLTNADMPSFNITSVYAAPNLTSATCVEVDGFPKAISFIQYGQGGGYNPPSIILRGTNPTGDASVLDEKCDTTTADALIMPTNSTSSFYFTFFE